MTNAREYLGPLLKDLTGDEKHSASSHSTLDVLWVLYDRVLRYDPRNPRSEQRDRFVLSKGHGPVAYYAILADKGFFPLAELKKFRQWDGILGAHPDRILERYGTPQDHDVEIGLTPQGIRARITRFLQV